MRGRARPALVLSAAAAAVAVAALLLVRPGPAAGMIRTLTGGGSRPSTTSRGASQSRPAARAASYFLDHYERPDGQVVRTDQGGDTVSEGEAYAMLVAVATGERGRFVAAWDWSRSHLQEPDGLLAWRYSAGRVVDAQPAADADTLASWALVLAARRFGTPSYREEARRLSDAVLGQETKSVSGHRVLLAGPWAGGAAPIVNPSYLGPEQMRELAGLDGRWLGAAGSADQMLSELVSGGRLAPDWAVVTPDGTAHPTTPPGRPSAGVVYGYDAVRLPVLLAASCHHDEVAMAGSMWPTLQRDVDAGAPLVGLDLGGSPSQGVARDPVGEVGAAAAALAAGHPAVSRQLLARAQYGNGMSPTYFGSAWVALGRLLLEGSSLVRCG